MRAGIFDPYLDTIGGGERYAMTVAETLLKKGWSVDVFWKNEEVKSKLMEKFSLEVERINFISYSPVENNLFTRRKIENSYDLLFYFSDGSVPFMFGKKNLLHFQVPFKNVLKRSLKNNIKLRNIFAVVCNSNFTKKFIDEGLGISSKVIFPPVDVAVLGPMTKRNVVLSVGRFSQLLQGKRQDVLVDVFKEMVKEKKIRDWKLVLAGGSEVGSKEYLRQLRESSNKYPIEIIENPSFKEIKQLYGEAKIFWTASGYGIDENREPERVEHFGMTTVEAMAAGCAPIVMEKGGQKEIIKNGQNGFFWQEKEELEKLTLDLLKDPAKLQKIAKNAILRSKDFSKEIFSEKFLSLVNERS